MTKAPQTVEEARARQATIAGGMGALGVEPFVKEEPMSKSLGDAVTKRQHARKAAADKITRWK